MRIEVCFSFLLFNAMIFLMRRSQVILCFYGGCILHELGHIIAAAFVDMKPETVIFKGSGIVMITKKNCLVPVKKNVFVLLSGPAANLVAGMFFAVYSHNQLCFIINSSLCIYNLLPFPGLDGGAVADVIFSGSPHEYLVSSVIFFIRYAVCFVSIMAVFCGFEELLPLAVMVFCQNIFNDVNRQ